MPRVRQPKRSWNAALVRGVLLWIVPVAAAWLILTPVYNRFLDAAGERLVRLTERPPVTHLYVQDTHFALVTRTDFASEKGHLYRIRLTDLHFNLILTGAMFHAVPGIPRGRRWENLGWASLISIFFHILLLFFFVKFVYATQLGSWSGQHYGSFGQNFWGMGKHLLDLPFKFALPLILWAAFYYEEFLAHVRPA